MAWILDPSPTVPTSAAWNYAAQEDVEDLIGSGNLVIICGDGTTIDTAKLQRAGIWADNEIDSRLAVFGFSTPLAGTNSITDNLMTQLSAKLTVWQVNQSRALISLSDTNGNQSVAGIDDVMEHWKREAESLLSSIGLGTRVISATKVAGYDDAATAITGRLGDNTINRQTLNDPEGRNFACGIWQ